MNILIDLPIDTEAWAEQFNVEREEVYNSVKSYLTKVLVVALSGVDVLEPNGGK